MLTNYIRVAVRNLLKHRAHSVINIAGLSLGIACFLLMALFVLHETDQDRFHLNGDRIYRVLRLGEGDAGNTRRIGVTSAPFADGLRLDFPNEIEDACRVWPNNGLVQAGDKSFLEDKFYLADANFFQFFTFPLVAGSSNTVLQNPGSVVISSEVATKLFGRANPIGQRITVDKQHEFLVTGVMGKAPGNSHLQFDYVATLSIFRDRPWFKKWWDNTLLTYIRLAPTTTAGELNARFPAFMEKYFGDSFRQTGMRMQIVLEPLRDIYFDYETQYDSVVHGRPDIVILFSAIALFILLLSCINFINLSTAKATLRAREVGVRKVMGAQQANLIIQFVGESVLLALVACCIGVLLTELVLPQFNSILDRNISLGSLGFGAPVYFFILAVVVGLIAGSYPAFVLARYEPVRVLKAHIDSRSGGAVIRKGLVVFQFTISILLIICTSVVFKQMDYLRTTSLGFTKDQIVIVPINNGDIRSNRKRFKEELLRSASVTNVSMMSGEPGGFHDNYTFAIEGIAGPDRRIRTVFTDFDYVRTFGLSIVEGRDFSKNLASDSVGILLNRTAVRSLGWTESEAIGKRMMITLRDSTWRTVVGVVDDFHFESLKESIQPLAISIVPDYRVFAVRVQTGNMRDVLTTIEQAWNTASPGFPFAFEFLNQSFNKQYKNEERQQKLFIAFAIVAISIACLGLFGLAAYTAEQRTKEIGVRKVLGASVAGIVGLLSTEFFKLVLIANILAFPIAYFVTNRWLQDFAYRTEIGAGTYLLSASMALIIAIATISYQAIRSAISNPIDALKYE